MVWAVLAGQTAQAAFELTEQGPRATGMGGAGTALAGDGWAVCRNPALAVDLLPTAAVAWSQQFGLPELTRESFMAGLELRTQPLAIAASTLGSEVYRENEVALIVARKLGERVTAGVEARADNLAIEGYSSATVFALTAGLSVRPTARVSFGVVWRNLNEPKLPGYRDRISESLTIGVAARVVEQGMLAADVVQEKHFAAEYRIGAEARVMSRLFLRVGVRAEPVRPSAGFQIDLGRCSFLYAGDLHPDLGASHEFGLSFRFER